MQYVKLNGYPLINSVWTTRDTNPFDRKRVTVSDVGEEFVKYMTHPPVMCLGGVVHPGLYGSRHIDEFLKKYREVPA